jgi:hypothetical protein
MAEYSKTSLCFTQYEEGIESIYIATGSYFCLAFHVTAALDRTSIATVLNLLSVLQLNYGGYILGCLL